MSNQEFLARPRGVGGSHLLREHLETARDTVAEITTEEGPLVQVARVAAYLHDFGKLTSWFQEYIHEVDASEEGDSVTLTREQRRRKQHARLSAYAVEYCLNKRGIDQPWRTCAFVAVARHHQSLPDTRKALTQATNLNRKRNQKRFELMQEQFKNIYQTAPGVADELLSEASDGAGGLTDFCEYLVARQTHETLCAYEPDAKTYAHLLHLWGIVITADKLASAGLNVVSPVAPSPAKIDDYIDDFASPTDSLQQQLNRQREQARESVLNNISRFQATESNLGTITLPTGFGKTLTGLQAALSLVPSNGRIIYALPYTSIIDQVDAVMQEVFEVSPADPEYTIHHHLAETRTLPDDDRVDTDASELLAKTWQAPMVLTTFVQLFESLAGPTNRQSMKIPALENAVIILDEPQALPKKWWRFVAWAIDLLVAEFDATVVLMTATQPELLDRLPHATAPFELVDDAESYFEFLQDHARVRYTLDQSMRAYLDAPRSAPPLPLDTAVNQLLETDEISVLSVGNTVANVIEQGKRLEEQLDHSQSLNTLLNDVYQDIPSAEALTDKVVSSLVEAAQTTDGPIVATLTARLRPIDRTVLLQAIRQLLREETPIYVASTQLIEAGVDLSFDRLYRDFAPFPSLVQAAGRCNREFGGETSDVTIWRLANHDNGPPPSELIYGDPYDLLSPTRATLRQLHSKGHISEYRMANVGATEYFRRLHQKTKPGDRSLVQAAEKAAFRTLGAESLIRERGDQIDIFVAVTANETHLFDAYQRFVELGRYDRVQAIRDVMQKRVISVSNANELATPNGLVQFPDATDTYYFNATDPTGSGPLDTQSRF